LNRHFTPSPSQVELARLARYSRSETLARP
jgi:hypothetical protein